MRHYDPMRLYSGLPHFFLLKKPGSIVADLANVAGLQSPARASCDSRGHLAAWKDLGNAELHLGIKCREMREADERIGGIQPHADDINDGCRFRHTDTLRKSESGARENEREVGLIIFSRCGVW